MPPLKALVDLGVVMLYPHRSVAVLDKPKQMVHLLFALLVQDQPPLGPNLATAGTRGGSRLQPKPRLNDETAVFKC